MSLAVDRAGRRWWLWLAAALALVWIAGIGQMPLFDVDEGAFAEASREMLTSGDLGHTTLSGADRFDKPILVYWLQTASMALFGVNPFAARLPSALCALAWCLALAWFAAPRWGVRVAVGAAVLLAGAAGPMLIGRAATADALLNLLLTLAGLDLWRHLESGAKAPLRRAALWIGLGLLAKGPVALLVPGATLLLWVAVSRRWRVLGSVLSDLPGWIILVGVAAPWYVYALNRHGRAFVEGFILRHNLDRFGGPLEGHQGSLAYYLILLPILVLPWAALLAPVLRQLRAGWSDPLDRWLWLWFSFVLVFFSLSGTKLPHYLLYGLTPVMLLAARALPAAGTAMVGAVALPALGLVALAPAATAIAQAVVEHSNDPFVQTLLALTGLPPAPPLWLAALFGLAIVALLLWRRGPGDTRILGCVTLAAASLLTQTLPWWGQVIQGPVVELARLAHDRPQPLVQWQLHQPSVAFIAERPAPRRPPQPGELALTRRDRLSSAELSTLDVVAERRGYLLVQQR